MRNPDCLFLNSPSTFSIVFHLFPPSTVSLRCLCRATWRLHRIPSKTSCDRTSSTLPQINPRPGASATPALMQHSPRVCVMSNLAVSRAGRPGEGVAIPRQHCSSGCSDMRSCLLGYTTIVRFFPFPVSSPLDGCWLCLIMGSLITQTSDLDVSITCLWFPGSRPHTGCE